MGRKSKFDQEMKLEVVREYLNGKASQRKVYRIAWLIKMQMQGENFIALLSIILPPIRIG